MGGAVRGLVGEPGQYLGTISVEDATKMSLLKIYHR